MVPAKNTYRINDEGVFFHIYNRGVAEGNIFRDPSDYETFLNFLKDYLSPQNISSENKKSFTIRGKAFQGTPRLPKNHHEQVQLVAYSLLPDHFHLVLYQAAQGSVQHFLRSLCTRYSIYFNKKYQRSGPLFEGPYKSVQVDGTFRLPHLTRYLHLHSNDNSSYNSYLEGHDNTWIKPRTVLSLFEKSGDENLKGSNGYKNFVEKYVPNQQEEKLLEGILIESKERHQKQTKVEPKVEYLENQLYEIIPTKIQQATEELRRITPQTVVEQFVSSEVVEEVQPEQVSVSSRVPEVAVITIIFLFLFGLGVSSIYRNNNNRPSSTTRVLETQTVQETTQSAKETTQSVVLESTSSQQVSGVQDTNLKLDVKVKTSKGIDYVNIRKEPKTNSTKVGEAKDGGIFELVSMDSGWCGVRLEDGSVGYISASFLEMIGGVN